MGNKKEINPTVIRSVVKAALREDVGAGDVTTEVIIDKNARAQARIIAKESGVIAGLPVAKAVFTAVDKKLKFIAKVKDSSPVSSGEMVAEVRGTTRSLLFAERTALNFLQRLSGIATLTRKYVDAVSGTKAKILDTRKTTPNLRILEKYAVRMGGGQNHRLGLYDMILIKDNHIAAAGSITEAVKKAQRGNKKHLAIEVETRSLTDVQEALAAGVKLIMLDNMEIASLKQAVELVRGRAKLEASGGVNLTTVRSIAETGVDFISIGALTHSAPALDLSMEIKTRLNHKGHKEHKEERSMNCEVNLFLY
jgi:nicotinate-nucleotide pyrophosphorylase (carboxylating)